MHRVTSFNSHSVGPEELSVILSDYFTLEHLRSVRRLMVVRFGILAVAAAVAGWLWLSTVAAYVAAAACLVPPLYVLTLEVTRERRLAHRLEQIPGQGTDVLPGVAGPRQKVIKSS